MFSVWQQKPAVVLPVSNVPLFVLQFNLFIKTGVYPEFVIVVDYVNRNEDINRKKIKTFMTNIQMQLNI